MASYLVSECTQNFVSAISQEEDISSLGKSSSPVELLFLESELERMEVELPNCEQVALYKQYQLKGPL